MSFHLCATFAVLFVASGCASSSSGDPFGENFDTTATERVNRGNSTWITRSELAQYAGDSTYRAIEQIRRRWVTARRGGRFARVVIDGYRTDLSQLRAIRAQGVEELRFLSAADATTKYGTGFPDGAIEVMMRSRR